jgi:hypothetical protein
LTKKLNISVHLKPKQEIQNFGIYFMQSEMEYLGHAEIG